jgi:hypothetical protein
VGQLDYLTGKELRELKAMRRSVLLRAAQIRAEAALNRVRVECVADVAAHALGSMADINISRQMHVARTYNPGRISACAGPSPMAGGR